MRAIAVIEDNAFLREAWVAELTKGNCTVHEFDSPASFWRKVDGCPEFADRIGVVITDFFFADDEGTGADLARLIRERLSCPVVLCSSVELTTEEFAPFTVQLGKWPISWQDVAQALEREWPGYTASPPPVRIADRRQKNGPQRNRVQFEAITRKKNAASAAW